MKGTVRVYHDIPFEAGNIDHVVLCNQGVFVLNTKTMNLLKDAENTSFTARTFCISKKAENR